MQFYLQGISVSFNNSRHQLCCLKSPPLCYTINNTLVLAHDKELGCKTSLNNFLLRHLLKGRSCLSVRKFMQAVQQMVSEICKCYNSPSPHPTTVTQCHETALKPPSLVGFMVWLLVGYLFVFG
jgi:hypothetical protein